jgi:hypothetical protein
MSPIPTTSHWSIAQDISISVVAVGSQNLSLAKIPFAHNLLIFGENNEVACWSSFRVSFGLFDCLPAVIKPLPSRI